MKLIITGKNIALTDVLKDTVNKKLSKLDRYLLPDTEVQVVLSVQINTHIIEVTIPANGMIIRAEEASEDMHTSIDAVVKKLEQHIIKYGKKLEERTEFKTLLLENILDQSIEENELKIVKTKRFTIDLMDIQEAILQMDLLGHDFFVFKNSNSNELNIVYKRKDGNYGLIELDS